MKKIISVIIAMLLAVMPAAAQEESKPENSGEAKLLFTLGIVKEAGYNGRQPVKRGDFASSVASLIGLSAITHSCNTVFPDVTEKSKNSGAVKVLSDMGIVSGYDSGLFGENDTLKTEQAVKIVMRALGYGAISEAYGGYPASYLIYAQTSGLLKKVKAGSYEECTWNDAAQLLYNALFIDIAEDENGDLKTLKGRNALTAYHDVQIYKGVVSGNDITSFSGTAESEGYVRIGGERFLDRGNLCENLLGMKVECYFKNSYNEKELLLVRTEGFNKEIKVSATDIAADKSSSERLSYYDEKGVIKNMGIEQGAVVIFNGKYQGRGINNSDLEADNGSIRLVDNDKNGKADVVFIEKAEIYVVESINTVRLTIEDMYNMPAVSLDREDAGFKYKILWSGTEVPFSEIVKGSVLSVLKSVDGNYTEIHICADRVRGTVTERNDVSVTVDGTAYGILKGFENRVSDITIGSSAMFYLDEYGRIAGCSKPELSGLYGYLIETGPAGDGLNEKDKGLFRIFSLSEAKIQNYESASNIKLYKGSGEEGKLTGREIAEKFREGGSVKRQLIKYGLNSKGDITEIYTAKKNTSNPKGHDDANFSLDFDYPDTNNPMPGWNYLVYSDSGVISNRYLTSGAVCLSVPSENSDGSINEKNIHMFNINEYPDSEQLTKFKIYDSNESRHIGVLVLEGGKSGLMPEDELFIFDEYGMALSDEGDTVERIYGYEKGEYKGYNVSPSSQMTNAEKKLGKGDAVKLVKDDTGVLSLVKLFAADPSTSDSSYKMTGKYYDDWVKYLANAEYIKNPSSYWHQKSVVIHARPTFATKSTLLVSFENGAPDKVLPITSQTKMIKYDMAKKELQTATWEDIEPNNKRQTVVVQVSYQETYDVLIINRDKNVEPIWKGSYNN